MWNILRVRYWLVTAVVILVGAAAAITAYVSLASSAARAADVGTAKVVPLSATTIPADVRTAIQAFSMKAGLPASGLVEVGRSSSSEAYRATIVGVDSTGGVQAAIATGEAVTNFARMSEVLKAKPFEVLFSTTGTTTELNEVGLTILAKPPVARVEVVAEDGSASGLVLTHWPVGPYSSASTVTDEASRFPSLVRVFDANGDVVGAQKLNVKALCPPSTPNCVD